MCVSRVSNLCLLWTRRQCILNSLLFTFFSIPWTIIRFSRNATSPTTLHIGQGDVWSRVQVVDEEWGAESYSCCPDADTPSDLSVATCASMFDKVLEWMESQYFWRLAAAKWAMGIHLIVRTSRCCLCPSVVTMTIFKMSVYLVSNARGKILHNNLIFKI